MKRYSKNIYFAIDGDVQSEGPSLPIFIDEVHSTYYEDGKITIECHDGELCVEIDKITLLLETGEVITAHDGEACVLAYDEMNEKDMFTPYYEFEISSKDLQSYLIKESIISLTEN